MPSQPLHHIVNGDVTRDLLAQAGVSGEIAVWADVLHEGPVRLDFGDEARHERARFIATLGWPESEVDATLQRWDDGVARAAEIAAETILWLEHDLFDQLLLVRHLAWFGQRPPRDMTLSVICIGAFPGHPRFHGLGQLSPVELGSLLPRRRPVTPRMIEHATAVWRAFTGPDPRALEPFTQRDDDFPYLGDAITRLLEEYPAPGDGLPRTERQALHRLATQATTVGDLFREVQLDEQRVFMGDTTFAARMTALADGPRPLVTADGDISMPTTPLRITETGRHVLAGRADWTALQPLDRHIGGVHLTGAPPRWRWDADQRRVVDAGDRAP